MALVTVLSVMNGFERDLEQSILNLMPQAVVTTRRGSWTPPAIRHRCCRGCPAYTGRRR